MAKKKKKAEEPITEENTGGNIRKCVCRHDFQDGLYGVGMRLHNRCKNGEAWRCTVCGKERS